MASRSIVSPEDQKVTFVELFFDLVFVFSVTQVVGLLHDELDAGAVGRAVLVFWLVWWAWTQFTWALNAADTTHPLVELATLLATALAFFMAVAVPEAFGDAGLLFAATYVLVRAFGLALYGRVAAAAHPSQHAAVRVFALVSVGGLAAVLAGGLVGGGARYGLWGLAILLDVVAAAIGGRQEGWNLHPEHFGERHGLFVIIALGETLIVAAAGLSGAPWTAGLVAVAVLSVAIACGFWWTYFTCAKLELDRALEAADGARQSTLARDVYSLAHFPMVCGIIAFAAVVEEAVAHPGSPLPLAGRGALAAALLLFVGGMVPAMWRATRRLLLPRRLAAVAASAAILLGSGLSAPLSLAVALAGTVAAAALEGRSVEAAVLRS